MSRSPRSYLQDMLAALRKIEDYTVGLSVDGFKDTSLVIDGVCMNEDQLDCACWRVLGQINNKATIFTNHRG